MSTNINAMKPEIARKAIEMGVRGADRFEIHLLAERQGLGQPEMAADAIRDFLMAYLEEKRARPVLEPQTIAFIHPTKDGVDCGHLARFHWMRFDRTERHVFRDMLTAYRYFERSGPVRRPSDIEGRPIGECAMALMESRLGQGWRNAVKTCLGDLYKYRLDPFKSGYRQIGEGVGIKLSGEELLVSIDLKSISYRNSTLTVRDDGSTGRIPESAKMAVAGKSLASIVTGLPDHPCFHRTVATTSATTHRSWVLTFDEPRIPIAMQDAPRLAA